MSELPAGTLTFVFTDVQGSTRHWEADPESMRLAMEQHDAIAKSVIERHQGCIVHSRGEGDSLFVVFDLATNAVSAALALQTAFASREWPIGEPIKVRMAVGTSDAAPRESDYHGAGVNRFARLRAIGHGGQVLVAQSTRELVCDSLPDGITLIDLGDHQLADLIRPERVYQLAGAGLASDFPPLRSLNLLPNNLPRQATSFIGRTTEISDLKKLVHEHDLVTVTGSGGVGKSRICFQVAADLIGGFPDGVWATDLASVTVDDQAQSRIASSVGGIGMGSIESAVAAIRSKSMLVVIDNCEHVIDGVRAMVQAVLTRCPNVKVLATSRERLDIPGEALYRLPSLGVPDPKHLPRLGALTEFDSIRLFLQRARLLNEKFEITPSNAGEIAETCSRLDGIPLAIELAASRTNVLSPAEIAKRLNQRFKLLTGGSRVALPRQQTLLATIEWGYDLLTENEKLLLRRLSVFVDGWTMEAADQVCSGDGIEDFEVLDLMTSLIDKSMVLPYDDKYGHPRYRLLETIRQFAAEKLAATGQMMATRQRHCAYYERMTAATGERDSNRDATDAARNPLTRTERGNCFAAIDYLCEPGVCVDASRACQIYRANIDADDVPAGRACFETICGHLPLVPNYACAMALASYAGLLATSASQAGVVLTSAEDAIALSRTARAPEPLFVALMTAAGALNKLGRDKEADDCCSEAESLAKTLGGSIYARSMLARSAEMHWTRGGYRRALEAHERLIALDTAEGTDFCLAYDYLHAGHMRYMLGDHHGARQAYDQAGFYFDKLDIKRSTLSRFSAELNCAVGDYSAGWRDLLTAYENLVSAGHHIPLYFAVNYEVAAFLHASEGAFEAAGKMLGAATTKRQLAGTGNERCVPERHVFDKIRALIVAGVGEDECARLIAEGEKLTDEQAEALMARQGPPTAEGKELDDV